MPIRELYGLFGGTFDPFHYGHLAPVKELFQSTVLAKVVYIPTSQPAHRCAPEATAKHRLAMTKIALASEPDFLVDDIEMERSGPSYTIDTLRLLLEQQPDRRYVLIVGIDVLLNLETWHQWKTLQQNTHIIAMARPGWQLPQPLPTWWNTARVTSLTELFRAEPGKIFFVESTPPPLYAELSASRIRNNIRDGNPVSLLLPPGVWSYIRTHRLYNCPL